MRKSTKTVKVTKAKTNKKTDQIKQQKLSPIVKPNKMSIEEWQVALRKQMANTETYGIKCVDDRLCPGEYVVANAFTSNEYKVVYRGEDSEWNFCSCMDFKTSKLGTCKHIEAVKNWIKGKRGVHVHSEIPPYTSVYLSYRGERCVKIRIGSDDREAYEALAKRYFDDDNTLKPEAFATFGSFTNQARQISDTFRCYDDAIDFVVDHREKIRREAIVDAYNDEKLNSLLKVKLYPYQRQGIRFAARSGKAIIADEMGLGKTIQAIGTAELLRNEGLVGSVLIVCPTSLKYQWQSELRKFTDAQTYVIEGNHLKRKEAYNRVEPYKIVSYNSLCNDIKILGGLQTDMLIMDEVQRLKNWNTQISRAARKIKADYKVLLSGTPLENKLEELYSIVEFVDNYRLAPYYVFRQEHVVTDDSGKILEYKKLNDIGRQLSDILIRRRKKDVKLQMPKRSDKILLVPMTKEQQGMHDEWKSSVAQLVGKWRIKHFLSENDRKRLLLMLCQMRMVCDSTYIIDQKSRNDTKVDECVNIISNIMSEEGEKVVVFSQWERMTRIIAQELEKKDISYEYLNGGVPSEKRKAMIDNFTSNPESRVFLSTDAGCTGLNLQVASTIINVDLPWNPAVLEQRIGRIYRLGQKNNIQVINLVTPYSIEETIVGKLRFKSSMFEGVLDNGEDSVFADNDKFGKLMETVGSMVDDISTDDKSVSVDDCEPKRNEDNEPKAVDKEFCDATMDGDEAYENEICGVQRQWTNDSQQPSEEIQESDRQSYQSKSAIHQRKPKELVAQGVSFISGLAETLKSPEATAQLVETIVERDEATGETVLKIPVESKETVSNLLNLIGRMFAK